MKLLVGWLFSAIGWLLILSGNNGIAFILFLVALFIFLPATIRLFYQWLTHAH